MSQNKTEIYATFIELEDFVKTSPNKLADIIQDFNGLMVLNFPTPMQTNLCVAFKTTQLRDKFIQAVKKKLHIDVVVSKIPCMVDDVYLNNDEELVQ